MVDIILFVIIAAAVGGSGMYIYKSKKNGNACVGCPDSKRCGSKSCNCSEKTE